jgi:dihydrofolate reductase
MSISLIVAQGDGGEIGRENKLLWKLPEDMQRFKDLTVGKVVVMGRKTYESIGVPLRDRTNVVISRTKGYMMPPEVAVLNDPADVFRRYDRNHEIMIIGGTEIYKMFLPFADKIYLTQVHQMYPDADAFFPDIGEGWRVTNIQPSYDYQCNIAYDFITLEKPHKFQAPPPLKFRGLLDGEEN